VIGQATCIVVAEAHARVLRIAIGKLLSMVRAAWYAVKGRGSWLKVVVRGSRVYSSYALEYHITVLLVQ
jgi:hypothetical protein